MQLDAGTCKAAVKAIGYRVVHSVYKGRHTVTLVNNRRHTLTYGDKNYSKLMPDCVTGEGDSKDAAIVEAYQVLYGALADRYFTLGVVLQELKPQQP